MRIDVRQHPVGYDGKPIYDEGDRDHAAPVSLRKLLCHALLAFGQADGKEKARRFVLAERIFAEDEPDLAVEEFALLKELTGMYPAGVVGPVWRLLDPVSVAASPRQPQA